MIKIAVIFLLFPIITAAQTVDGKIVDDATNQALAYVNIGIIGTNVGTVSDEKGSFTLSYGDYQPDAKVRISIIGYKPEVIELQALKESTSAIRLTKKRVELADITVNTSRLNRKRKGNKATSKNIVTGWNEKLLGGEQGIRIKVGSKPIYIQSLHFHIANNSFEEVWLRVHFREFENDRPSHHVVNQDILVPVRVKSGWVQVDLEEYNLVFEDDVAVTLQPVQRKGRCDDKQWCFHLSANMFKLFGTSWLVYKMSSEAEWRIKKNWSPGIYLEVYE